MLAFMAGPALAQQPRELPPLKDLIPDSAVANPEDWAKAPTVLPTGTLGAHAEAKPAAADASSLPSTQPPVMPVVDLRPESPIADIIGLDLPWPDGLVDPEQVPKLTADAADAAQLAKAADALGLIANEPRGQASRESVLAGGRAHLVWNGEPAEREALEARFRGLSALQGLGKSDADAMTQVVVRGSADRKVLETLMRIYGYYDVEVAQSLVTDAKSGEQVRFDIDSGQRYRIGAITLGDIDGTGRDADGLVRAYGINRGDPLALDAITAGSGRLGTALHR